jgi:hypothetical protein
MLRGNAENVANQVVDSDCIHLDFFGDKTKTA